MPTDYKKLLELCPEIDRVDDVLRKALPGVDQKTREELVIADSVGTKAVQGALEAQPELLEEARRTDERNASQRYSDTAIREWATVRGTAVDELRKVCRTPST